MTTNNMKRFDFLLKLLSITLLNVNIVRQILNKKVTSNKDGESLAYSQLSKRKNNLFFQEFPKEKTEISVWCFKI